MQPSSRFPGYVQVNACSTCCVCLLTLFIFTWVLKPAHDSLYHPFLNVQWGMPNNRTGCWFFFFFFFLLPGHYKHFCFLISEPSYANWKCAFMSLIIVNSLNFRKRPVNLTVSISCGTNKDFLNVAHWACPLQSFLYNITFWWSSEHLLRCYLCFILLGGNRKCLSFAEIRKVHRMGLIQSRRKQFAFQQISGSLKIALVLAVALWTHRSEGWVHDSTRPSGRHQRHLSQKNNNVGRNALFFLNKNNQFLTLHHLEMLDEIDDDHYGAVVPPVSSLLL